MWILIPNPSPPLLQADKAEKEYKAAEKAMLKLAEMMKVNTVLKVKAQCPTIEQAPVQTRSSPRSYTDRM